MATPLLNCPMKHFKRKNFNLVRQLRTTLIPGLLMLTSMLTPWPNMFLVTTLPCSLLKALLYIMMKIHSSTFNYRMILMLLPTLKSGMAVSTLSPSMALLNTLCLMPRTSKTL